MKIILNIFLLQLIFVNFYSQEVERNTIKTGIGLSFSNNIYHINKIDNSRYKLVELPNSVSLSFGNEQNFRSNSYYDIIYSTSKYKILKEVIDTTNKLNNIIYKKLEYIDFQLSQNFNYYKKMNFRINIIGGFSGGIIVRGSNEIKGIKNNNKISLRQFNSVSFSTTIGNQIVFNKNKYEVDFRISWRHTFNNVILHENNNIFPVNFYLGIRYLWDTGGTYS